VKFIEETILLVSVSWIVIYLYGLFATSSSAFSFWLVLIPVLLFLILIVSFFKKTVK